MPMVLILLALLTASAWCNDLEGAPIEIAAVVVWQVHDAERGTQPIVNTGTLYSGRAP